MRINEENKSIDIEPREINYIMEALVTSYLFQTKNQMPEVITFPMYKSAKTRYGEIPINFGPDTSEVAEDIVEDGSNVPEVTPKQEAVLDEKDEEIKRLRAELAKVSGTVATEEPAKQAEPMSWGEAEEAAKIRSEELAKQPAEAPPTSPARAAFATGPASGPEPPPDRQPKQPPGGDLGPGLGLSDMHHRDVRDQARTARDLTESPGGEDESAEIPYEKVIKRDKQGRPVIEELPDDSSGQE